METKPRLMPLLPLRGMLVFPGMIINLDVGRERSIHAVEATVSVYDLILKMNLYIVHIIPEASENTTPFLI